MFVQLDIGWMNHPFPTSSFRISSAQQIEVLRELGLQRVRYVPSKSVLLAAAADGRGPEEGEPGAAAAGEAPADADADEQVDAGDPQGGAEPLLDDTYEALQERCRERYEQAASTYAAVSSSVDEAPVQAREGVEALVRQDVTDLLAAENYAVHLLTQVTAQQPAQHAVNVMVLALLLGRTLGLGMQELQHLGAAALLHDLGKIHLPMHIGEPGAALLPPDRRRYEEHVLHSVALAQRMGFGGEVLLAIGQHHEMADGSGFPRHLEASQLGRHGQILALVNRYDRLCSPLHGEAAHTPHEALARLFAQERKRFDATVTLGAFIRMMGVYPPGSLVQLDDGRYARVVASSSQYPLRPCVRLLDGEALAHPGQVIDLGRCDEPGIRRSVRPEALPEEMLGGFEQRRHCYFFERVVPTSTKKDDAS